MAVAVQREIASDGPHAPEMAACLAAGGGLGLAGSRGRGPDIPMRSRVSSCPCLRHFSGRCLDTALTATALHARGLMREV